MDEHDLAASGVTESARRIVDRALEEARRLGHPALTNEHVFLAFAHIERETFAVVMRDLALNPHEILQALEESLRSLPFSAAVRKLEISPATEMLVRQAASHASDAGRAVVDSGDLFAAVFQEQEGLAVSILRGRGIEPDVLLSRLGRHVDSGEQREEQLKKRFELPPFLKQFGTNLNHLAWQDRLPPVFGREREIQ